MDAANGPRVVGRYLLYDAIASGGMATVHLGRLVGPVGFSRTVAIKRMHESLAQDPEFSAMFLDEARIVTRIRHPNVVPTLDVVALDNELLVVMEYVGGVPLSLLLRRARAAKQPPPIAVIVDIMVGVLNGLHAAHEAKNEKGEPLNVVHRDVSPQNILVSADGVARVLDFGIVKSVGRTHQTATGQVKGKLHYMAPEQLRGKQVTPASDIFSVSLVLWEALTGEEAFATESEADLVHRMLESKAQPPSTLRPEIPPILDDIILQGLNKEPAERFISAKAMATALESAVPAVSRSAVGKWVQECAQDDLKRKAWHLACVESDFSQGGALTTPASGRPPLVTPITTPPPSSAPTRRDTPISASSPALALAHTTPPSAAASPASPTRRRAVVFVAGAALVAGAAILVGVATSTSNRSEGGPSFPVPAAPVAQDTPRAAPVEAAVAAPEPATSAAPQAPVASASASPRDKRPKPAKPRPAKEERGDRIYRRE
jgi:eukaryotic-like serine/threonine-protein kinase